MSIEVKPWYEIENVDEVDSPQLVVYHDRVLHNIRRAIHMLGGLNRLRPHVKTVKSSRIIRMMMDEGIHKFKCATIAEAELLAQCKADDVLLAYQPVGPKAMRFIRLMTEYPKTRFSCLVDNFLSAVALSDIATAENLRIFVYLDLNVGMNRSGVVPGDDAVFLYKKLNELPAITTVGLHAYDGHIHDADFASRKKACDAAFEPVETMRQAIVETGIPAPVIVAGGSPTFSIHLQRENVECSPGTFPYWDKGYGDAFTEQAFEHAALVVCRVVSLPAPGLACIDLGHKSIASENLPAKRAYFLNEPALEPVSHSEEHMVLKLLPGQVLQPGDVLYVLPWHICPTVALYERLARIEGNHFSGYWMNEARDRKLTI